MFINYGDKNFFDYGCLIDTEHSDTEYRMILCRPYGDARNKYQFAIVNVDINADWIDKKAVLKFAGMKEEELEESEENKMRFASALTDFYSWDNFGASDSLHDADWRNVSRKYIEETLMNQLIASDNLDMPWKDDPVTWECTDEDCQQYMKKLGDRKFQFIQFSRCNQEEYGMVFESTININDFTVGKIKEYLYSYHEACTINDILDIAYNSNEWQEIAECIFESQGYEKADSKVEAENLEHAKEIIECFIWERDGGL